MDGAWRKSSADGSTGRTLYRCSLRATRSLTPNLADHPKSIYLREDAVLPELNGWIAKLVTPEALATGQADSGQSSRVAAPRAQIAELDRKISALVGAIEAGVDVEQVSTQLARRAEKRADLDAKLREEGSRDRPDGGGDTEGARRPWRHRQDPAERRSRATTAVRLTRGEA